MPYLACTHAHTYSEYTTNGSCHWLGPKREYHVLEGTGGTGLAPALGSEQNGFHWVVNKLYVHNFLGFSTRLQPYTIYLGYLYLPPL